MDLARQPPALGQLLAGHLGDQVLEGAAVAVEAEVGEGGGRQQAAEDVEGLGPGRRLPRPLGLAGVERKALADLLEDDVEQLGEGLEEVVGGQLVDPVRQLGANGSRRSARPARAVEADVAGGLLERREADPGVLEGLGGERRHPLHGEVGARQLGDRVVAVADQDPLVELLRPAGATRAPGSGSSASPSRPELGLAEELFEEHPAEALLGPRVAREEGALDDLGQVPEGEDVAVEVGEVAFKLSCLSRREALLEGGCRVVGRR